MVTASRPEQNRPDCDKARQEFFEIHAAELLRHFPLRFLENLTPEQLQVFEDELWNVGRDEGIAGLTPERAAAIRSAVGIASLRAHASDAGSLTQARY